MRNNSGLPKPFKIICLAFSLWTGMSAQAGLFSNSRSWKEEVLLHDGHKIIIDRTDRLGGFPAIESRERETLSETVSFTLPGSKKKISWATDFKDSAPEPNSLNLLLLDIVDGIPYIATYPAGCIAYNKWGRPNPPYIVFKYDDNQWKRIKLEDLPKELKQPNVIVGGPPADLLKSEYSAEQVNELNDGIRTVEYRTIIRVPAAISESRCLNLVPRKGGGWETPGGFRSIKSITVPPRPEVENKN